MPRARKPRADSVLKNLPPNTQEAVWKMLNEEGPQSSYANVRERLAKEWDIETSESALGDFYEWYPTTARLRAAANFADQVREDLKKNPNLKIDDDALVQVGQAVFEAEAIRTKDPKTFIALQWVRNDRVGKLNDSRRVKLLEAKAQAFDELKKKAGTPGGPSAETLADIEQRLKLL